MGPGVEEEGKPDDDWPKRVEVEVCWVDWVFRALLWE